MHLKKQNGDTFGDGFVLKYLCLGWVITVRMLLLMIPVAVVLLTFASIIGGRDAMAPMGAILMIAFEIVLYWWLGLLIAASKANDTLIH